MSDLEAIKARSEAASPGPWEGQAYRVYMGDRVMGDRIVAACWRPWGPVTGDASIEADVEFIAHARTDVPALVAEVERLRRGMALILEFCDPPDDENGYCGCQEIAEEALGNVHAGRWFGPENVER